MPLSNQSLLYLLSIKYLPLSQVQGKLLGKISQQYFTDVMHSEILANTRLGALVHKKQTNKQT